MGSLLLLGAGGSGSAAVSPGGPTTGAHRYWRVNVTAATSACSIAELEFWLDGTTKHTITGGTVIASGTGAGAAADVFNGNLSDFWYSGNVNSGWIGYDFGPGNDKAVSMVAICGRAGVQYPTAWTVDYSDDGSSWTTAFGGNSGTLLVKTELIYFTDPAGGFEHVRCRWTTDSSGAVRLATIETRTVLGGADTSGTALAKITSSNVVGTAASMFDGNISTEWATNTFPAFVNIYFPDNRSIAQIMLQASINAGTGVNQAPDELYVDTSPDGFTWTNVFSQTGLSAWSVSETRTFDI